MTAERDRRAEARLVRVDARVLHAITTLTERAPWLPNLRELVAETGLPQTTVHTVLGRLQAQGAVHYRPGQPRTLHPTSRCTQACRDGRRPPTGEAKRGAAGVLGADLATANEDSPPAPPRPTPQQENERGRRAESR